MTLKINTPISKETVDKLSVGDMVYISGNILCGRDAVLPRIVEMIEKNVEAQLGVSLNGSVIFHTAVSPAGVGPTSSNKIEIESSIEPLSRAGVRLHLGKGQIHPSTVEALDKYGAAYAIIPPVTALLGANTLEQKLIAFPELGMEALYMLKVEHYPTIIGSVHGRSIYDD